ncbi:MAG: transporter permease subunit [Clostridiaceae bacterium]|jgi:arabinogalactan oligomer/maltooligosaccharide transport system permease protein|nr:transporter permease subunit [Clostridiaceae bacterium]
MKISEKFDFKDKPSKIIIIYAVLIFFCILSVFPILNILSIALRPSDAVYVKTINPIPQGATLANFREAFVKYDLIRWLYNSLIVSLLTTAIAVVLSIGAGYAFSRFEFFGRNTGMTLLLVTQMFPAPMMLLPLYIMLTKAGLSNNILGLAIVYVSTAIPFNIWMMKGYFDTIPKSLEESAYVDGAGIFKSFYQIILPLATPAIALTALFAFMGAWSEYIVARVILTDNGLLTLPIGLVNMQGQFSTDWGIYSAAALVTAIPVMILFVSLSKYLVGGLTLGSVKG